MNHPVGLNDRFKGNRDDLEAFRKLIAALMRSVQRDAALAEWSGYKLKRQVEHVRSRNRRPRGGRAGGRRAIT